MKEKLRFAGMMLRFLASGIPGFGAALATNVVLTGLLHWPKPLSYVIVMWVQMTINFFVCRRLVFRQQPNRPWRLQYRGFLVGNSSIRVFEWAFYTLLVTAFHFNYVLIQFVSVVLFSAVKFKFAESVFNSGSTCNAEALSTPGND